MSDYRTFFKSTENQNWFKCCLSVNITRRALVKFVNDEIESFKNNTLQDVLNSNNLIDEDVCIDCATPNVVHCQTRKVCQTRNGKCIFHSTPDKAPRQCPKNICDAFAKRIKTEHRFSDPSWKNTDATRWCLSAWEVAKCYMPPDGYTHVQSVEETDFNGLISIIINCKCFQQRFSDNLSKSENVCTKVRDIGRTTRHSPSLNISKQRTEECMKALVELLDDAQYLQHYDPAVEAKQEIIRLKVDSLTVPTTDIVELLNDALKEMKEETEQSRTQNRNMLEDIRKRLIPMDIANRSKTYKTLKKEFREDLVAFYQDRLSTMTLSPMMPEIDETLSSFYVSPKLALLQDRNRRYGAHSDEPVIMTSYSKMFGIGNDQKARNIYIQGEPGVGKSSFCTNMTTIWCDRQTRNTNHSVEKKDTFNQVMSCLTNCCNYSGQGLKRNQVAPVALTQQSDNIFSDTWVLSEFDFLLYISLRDARGLDCEIEAMVRNQIVSELSRSGQYHHDFIQTILNKERCLILLDGLDEWSHPESNAFQCRHKQSTSIPHRTTMGKSVIITTTRPWKMIEVRVKDSELDTLLEITGVRDTETLIEPVIKCLNNRFNKDCRGIDFITHVKEKSIGHLLSIPIILMQLICLWFEGRSIGQSKCEIYCNMIDMFLSRNLEIRNSYAPKSRPSLGRRSPNSEILYCFQNTLACQRDSILMKALGYLAFDTLFSQQKEYSIVFDERFVNAHLTDEQRDVSLRSGILSQHRSLAALTMRRSSYCFLHKTFQEFFAAYYVSTNEKETGHTVQVMSDVYGKDLNELDVAQIFIFVCGMNPHVAGLVSNELTETVTTTVQDNQASFQDVLGAVRSSQKMIVDGLSEEIANKHHSNSLVFSHSTFGIDTLNYSETEIKYLGQLMDVNKTRLMTYVARHYEVKPQELQMLLGQSSLTLSHITLHNVKMAEEIDVVQNIEDTVLDLSTCTNLKYIDMRSVSNVDVCFSGASLSFCAISFVHKSVEHEALQALRNGCPYLETLKLSSISNTDLLCEIIPTLNALKYLQLDFTNLSDADFEVPNSIQTITVRFGKWSVGVLRQLTETLKEFKQKVQCSFKDCNIVPWDMKTALVKEMRESGRFEINESSMHGKLNLTFRTIVQIDNETR